MPDMSGFEHIAKHALVVPVQYCAAMVWFVRIEDGIVHRDIGGRTYQLSEALCRLVILVSVSIVPC